jgi:hypothetical protein
MNPVHTTPSYFLNIHFNIIIPPSSKLHNEGLHKVYSSSNIIRMMKSRRMRWAGHVARMGRRGMHIGYWWGSQKERDHLEEKDVSGWTILK